jgi:hypothetical protein
MKFLSYVFDTWNIHAIAWLVPILSWNALHDFPPSSQGGYWHSFWITWLLALVISISTTIFWLIMFKKENRNE